LALLRLGRGAEAVSAFRTALVVTPDDAEATYYLGEALLATNDLAPALSAFGRAAVLAPHDPRCFKLMGRVLDRMGRTEEAMEMHRKAREAARR
jgi:Flp pilus assembly protein TadD